MDALMKLTLLTPEKVLDKVYLEQSVKREQIELFTANLTRLFVRLRSDESIASVGGKMT